MSSVGPPIAVTRAMDNDLSVELVPVAMASVLVAIAGPLGITLG